MWWHLFARWAPQIGALQLPSISAAVTCADSVRKGSMSFTRYKYLGHRRVGGYTESQVFEVVEVLNIAQRAKEVHGPVVEIGVHHGRLFLGLHLLQSSEEPSVAIDLFDEQELNVDQSGLGDLAKFRQHLFRWSDRHVVVHQGDSTQLKAGDIPEMAGARMFSVDGGHSAEIVESDMRLAAESLCEGGIIIADDVFNEQWPEVCVGTLHYLEEADVVPFAIGFNKTLFTQRSHAAGYRDALAAHFRERFLTAAFPAKSFAGHEVLVVIPVPRTPAHLARRSAIARRAYHRVVGLAHAMGSMQPGLPSAAP
jgi:hypothetical protein